MKEEKKTTKKYKKYLIIFWSLILTPIIGLVILFTLISEGYLGYMPSWEDLENPKSSLATQIISADGVSLGTFFRENRTKINYEDLSPYLSQALVATEDERFFDHTGVDMKSLFRAIIFMGKRGGGSTITQQLAKQLYHDPASNVVDRIIQKFNEWVMAVKLERHYTKEEIITMYFNKFDFLNLAVGIHSASHVYFDKAPLDLDIQEAATLVGMCKNPALFNPLRRAELVTKRRNVVLKQMKKNEYITQEVYDSLTQLPLDINFQRVDHTAGLAPYFREHIRLMMQAHKPLREHYYSLQNYYTDSIEWVDNSLYGWIDKNLKPDGTKRDLYRDGLQIYTTIDSRLQKHGEAAIEKHIGTYLQKEFWKEQKGRKKAPFAWDMTSKQINQTLNRAKRLTDRYRLYKRKEMSKDSIDWYFSQPVKMRVFTWHGDKDTVMSPIDSIRYYKYFLRGSLLSMDPYSGQIKAYVGGIDYQYFQYDMVANGRRQAGSTFKPILYSLALQEDFTPCSKLPNIPHTIQLPEGGSWSPRNADISKTDGQMITLKMALAHSNNYISAYLVDRYGAAAVVKMAKELGITSFMDAVPSICLGTPDVSLYEMLPMFCTFANKGVYTKPVLVTHIKDKDGNVVARFTPLRHEAYDERTAFLMVNLLEGVIDRGTSIRLRFRYKFKGSIYGKTGTTQHQSDGWFFGVTPQLATGIWVGGEDRAVHFKGIRLGQGANMALPVWALYMKDVYADKELNYSDSTYFRKPGDLKIELDCNAIEEKQIDDGLE